MIGTCDICGKENIEVDTICSTFGAFSHSCCRDCLKSGKESYDMMVTYIACAGRFPEDINEEYRTLVRTQLELYGISEKQFIKEVEERARDIFGR